MIRSLGLLARCLVTVTALALLPSTLSAQTAAQSARADRGNIINIQI